ncbi:uncharacterized protein LOC125514783 isoform X2 [Triticum urartu]|uniref:uncharacterized protein LOC125514783 isoform X2 n=1 Tax=Triticum urartu TaxID=4572 RepID=UPI0020448702|nr:uncharacterized protein LOC125514783 isoform X2 [Triticum urartu]
MRAESRYGIAMFLIQSWWSTRGTRTGLMSLGELNVPHTKLVEYKGHQIWLDTGMWTQPWPQISGNQDGDIVDGILGRPASFCLRPSPTMPVTCIQLLLPSSTSLLVSRCR